MNCIGAIEIVSDSQPESGLVIALHASRAGRGGLDRRETNSLTGPATPARLAVPISAVRSPLQSAVSINGQEGTFGGLKP